MSMRRIKDYITIPNVLRGYSFILIGIACYLLVSNGNLVELLFLCAGIYCYPKPEKVQLFKPKTRKFTSADYDKYAHAQRELNFEIMINHEDIEYEDTILVPPLSLARIYWKLIHALSMNSGEGPKQVIETLIEDRLASQFGSVISESMNKFREGEKFDA